MTLGLFNNKKVISIDFCSNEVRVVEGRYNKKNIIVDQCFSIEVPEGLYEDGIINDMEQFTDILHKGLSKNNISRGDVYAVINSSSIIIREIVIPKVDEKQVASILNYQLDEYLPVDTEGYVVQYLPLNVVSEDGVEKQNIMLVGVPKFIVEPHFNLLQNLGLKPVALDYAGNAISKLINFDGKINNIYDNDVIACVNLEEKGTAINITNNGVLSISRVIKEEIRSTAIESPFMTFDESNDQDTAAVSILRSNLTALLDKIDMVFRYYNSREIDKQIKMVMIYGSYSHNDGIEELMSNYFDIPCVKLVSLDKIKFFGDLAVYANAIGALIRVNGVKR
jgi:type IV pilus assembly protein PilM